MAAVSTATRLNQAEQRLVQAIQDQSRLDAIIDPVKQPVEQFLTQHAGLRSLLNGTWLGHAVHPVLTDIPTGAWTAGYVLDMLDAFGINRTLRPATDAVHTIGLVGALGAAVFGIADWSYTIDKPKRVGFVHGATNMLIAGIYAGSLVARSKGKRATGVALSSLGYDLLLLSSWLGGELSFRFGLGVDHTAFLVGPTEWADAAGEHEVAEGQLRRVEAQGVPVLLTRSQGHIYALADTCSHFGCSLAEGSLEQDMVVCPCHGSGFRLRDGAVLQGPATVQQPVFTTRVQAGRIEVRRAE